MYPYNKILILTSEIIQNYRPHSSAVEQQIADLKVPGSTPGVVFLFFDSLSLSHIVFASCHCFGILNFG
jgi:hypothetical protein